MTRVFSGLSKAVLVIGVGLAGLAGGAADATHSEPGHGMLCTVVGDCGR